MGLLKNVMRLSMTSLKGADAKEISSSVTAIANEKIKAEKDAAAGKKKGGEILTILGAICFWANVISSGRVGEYTYCHVLLMLTLTTNSQERKRSSSISRKERMTLSPDRVLLMMIRTSSTSCDWLGGEWPLPLCSNTSRQAEIRVCGWEVNAWKCMGTCPYILRLILTVRLQGKRFAESICKAAFSYSHLCFLTLVMWDGIYSFWRTVL